MRKRWACAPRSGRLPRPERALSRRAASAAVLLLLSFLGPPLIAQATDGSIGADEYPNSLSRGDGSYVLAWRIQGRLIHLGMSARTEGWVGVGIDPIVVLDNADFLYGWIDSGGEVQVRDARSLGPRGPIVEDTSLGGSNDILAFGGTLEDGRTTIEIVRFLDTGDEHDAPVGSEGGSRIVWAYGPDPSELGRMRQYGEAYLRPGEGLRPKNWWAAVTETPLYSAGLTAAFLLLATAMVLARLGRPGLGGHQLPGWIAVAVAGVLSLAVLLAPRGPLTLSAVCGILAAGIGAVALVAAASVSGPRRVGRILEWVSLLLLGGALAVALVRGGAF